MIHVRMEFVLALESLTAFQLQGSLDMGAVSLYRECASLGLNISRHTT